MKKPKEKVMCAAIDIVEKLNAEKFQNCLQQEAVVVKILERYFGTRTSNPGWGN